MTPNSLQVEAYFTTTKLTGRYGYVARIKWTPDSSTTGTAAVSSSVAQIAGDGSNYSYIRCPFPLRFQEARQHFPPSSKISETFAARRKVSATLPDRALKLTLQATDASWSTDLLTVLAADVPSWGAGAGWVIFGIAGFEIPSDIPTKALEIVFKTQCSNSGGYEIDKFCIQRGDVIPVFQTSEIERSNPAGSIGNFSLGAKGAGSGTGSFTASARNTKMKYTEG